MDETSIKIKGKWHYLYRTIDADGLTLDSWLHKKREIQAAYAFSRDYREPKVLVTDKVPSIGSAFKKIEKNELYTKIEHRTVKYLNSLIEQDHHLIKRRHKFYRSLRTPSTRIKVMKTIREIEKKPKKRNSV